MSAFIVSEKHIMILAMSYQLRDVCQIKGFVDADWDDIKDNAKILWRENHKAINYRYNEKNQVPRYRSETTEYYVGLIGYYSHEEIYKLCQCYEYQTEQHPEYKKSKAYKMIMELKESLAYKIISKTEKYESASWSI